MNHRISVIVPTIARQDIVLRFIDSLNQQTAVPQEFICVDASSIKAEALYSQRLRPDVKLNYIVSSSGLTHQRNVGIQAASGDLIFFFDDDIVLEPGFLQACVEEFDRPGNENVGVVYGTITHQAPTLQSTAFYGLHKRVSSFLSTIFLLPRKGNGKFQISGMPTFVIGESKVCVVECMPGGLTGYRHEVLEKLIFDELLSSYSYMEDDDMGKRVSTKYNILYTPAARCSHQHAAGGRLNEMRVGQMFLINHHYLFRKNFPKNFWSELAHIWSIIGYPVLQLWSLNWRRAIGAIGGIVSIILRLDQLSRLRLKNADNA